MITVKKDEICRFSNICPYNKNDSCAAAFKRDHDFICNLTDSNGIFQENGQIRNPLDTTGKMKIIMEDV